MSTKRLHTFVNCLMILLAMTKILIIIHIACFFGQILAITVDAYQRHAIISPYSASEVFYTGNEKQILAPAATSIPVAASAAPVPVFAPAPSLPFAAPVAAAAPLAFGPQTGSVATVTPAPALPFAAPVSIAPVAPVVAKVAQFKFSYPQYAYGYSVQDFTTGDNKVAKEVREGEIVKGSYSVADPDGTKRTVNYYADPVHGFNAVVHKTKILK